jgi:hypothetical protein
MTKVSNEWVYRTQDQYDIALACGEILNWNLYLFDCWLFDDSNWSMYTSGRQRMIASRDEMARLYPNVHGDKNEVALLLAAHCVTAWRCTRKGKLKPNTVVEDMEIAYIKARGMKRPVVPSDRIRRNSIAPGAATYGHFQAVHAIATSCSSLDSRLMKKNE